MDNSGKHPLQAMFEDLAEELGNDEVSVRSYSGRGMYGRQCLGVDTDMDIGSLVAYVVRAIGGLNAGTNEGEYTVEQVAEAFEGMQTDSMGRGTIVYFPSVQFFRDPGNEE
jgi:hypothetical protein